MAKIINRGKNNQILGNHDTSPDLTINIAGSNNTVFFGPECRLSGHLQLFKDRGEVRFLGANRGKILVYLKGNDCRLELGAHSKSNAALFINLAEDGCSVQIGEGCLFAGVKIRPSDSHKIRDITTGQRLNAPKPITLGNRVWVSEDTILLGGCDIGDGSVIGARSLVNGVIPANSLAVGVPAKAIKSNIMWEE